MNSSLQFAFVAALAYVFVMYLMTKKVMLIGGVMAFGLYLILDMLLKPRQRAQKEQKSIKGFSVSGAGEP